jgi:hypothetical protein
VEQREEVVYHLGGLAFELYRRELLTEPVMQLRAGKVLSLDESVRSIDARLQGLEEARRRQREQAREERRRPAKPVPLGNCANCGAPWFQPDARFCWSCGAAIEHPEAADEPDGHEPGQEDQPTTTMHVPEGDEGGR